MADKQMGRNQCNHNYVNNYMKTIQANPSK